MFSLKKKFVSTSRSWSLRCTATVTPPSSMIEGHKTIIYRNISAFCPAAISPAPSLGSPRCGTLGRLITSLSDPRVVLHPVNVGSHTETFWWCGRGRSLVESWAGNGSLVLMMSLKERLKNSDGNIICLKVSENSQQLLFPNYSQIISC